MNIFITGEEGMIAQELIKQFYRDGHCILNEIVPNEVKKFNRSSLPKMHLSNWKNEIDILDKKLLNDIMNNFNIDMVVHTAAYVGSHKCDNNPNAAYETNVKGTENVITSLVHSINARRCKFINFSTTATMDPSKYSLTNKITERTERKSSNPYNNTKIIAEECVKTFCNMCHIDYVNLLPVFIFGHYPIDNASIWSNLCKNSIQGITTNIKMDPNNFKQYVNVRNIAQRLIDVMFQAHCDDVIVAGDEIVQLGNTMYTFQEQFKRCAGKELLFNYIPKDDYLGDHVADNSYMHALTDNHFHNENYIPGITPELARDVVNSVIQGM